MQCCDHPVNAVENSVNHSRTLKIKIVLQDKEFTFIRGQDLRFRHRTRVDFKRSYLAGKVWNIHTRPVALPEVAILSLHEKR